VTCTRCGAFDHSLSQCPWPLDVQTLVDNTLEATFWICLAVCVAGILVVVTHNPWPLSAIRWTAIVGMACYACFWMRRWNW
jgi:hypothetical protein